MIRCAQFSFAFKTALILQDISFRLEKGACLSIIGPNGAGKSTLLKSLLRLHEYGQSSGAIFVGGRPLHAYSQRELAKNIAYVPQGGGTGALTPPFNVEEFLRLSRYPHVSRPGAFGANDREKVEKALHLTGLTNLASRPLNTLSGGERQKAYLAAALAQDAPVLLLDEPTSFLDPKHASEVNQLLKTLNREQHLTMLTVTHDLNHPLDAGGMVLALRNGRQLYFGPAADIVGQGILEAAFGHSFTYLPHPRSGKTVVLPD
ncbi:MAG: ABC transporter ATP-binding protein [Desulfovibrio sp.]|jgi:iron complex transport system ATP-binding protein|nr:ABC transporter ATP-binding protein [Desulfovibrio sp.]